MEALAYFDHHVPMRQDPNGLVGKMGYWGLVACAVEHGWGMPFEGGERRLRNHIAERLALQRNRFQPPLPGILLLGVYKEPGELRERILRRTEEIFPALYREWGAMIERCNGFYPEQAKRTIGYGDFSDAVNGGHEPIQSIFDRTCALAEWQTEEIDYWMTGITWVTSTDEAFMHYAQHLENLQVSTTKRPPEK
jgi:hypothetical protein